MVLEQGHPPNLGYLIDNLADANIDENLKNELTLIKQLSEQYGDWDIADYDDETEEGLKGHYTQLFNDVVITFSLLALNLSTPCSNAVQARCLNKMFNRTEIEFNQLDDMLKKLSEMGVEASEMDIISKRHARLTTRMLKIKEIVQSPLWNPAYFPSSE